MKSMTDNIRDFWLARAAAVKALNQPNRIVCFCLKVDLVYS